MKKIALAAMAFATALSASPAFSQIYFEYGTGPRYYDDRPAPRYYHYAPRYAYDDDDDDQGSGQRCWTRKYYKYNSYGDRVVRYRTVCD
ncbi:hypothetical protein [Rhizobium mesoamericanum]|uniref:Uncharacterized protein n=1 Tax=Rhizobium mesoamericanum STM3625 TaxID=1211777 RepID=K0PWS2_9HYPH|nr:hypothetical protein [Rhizobium mesoamericanum]CCM74264.1 exported hypothetical protein [Rhizobium mesoamericanum STM3625]